jgi:hypothetical protein
MPVQEMCVHSLQKSLVNLKDDLDDRASWAPAIATLERFWRTDKLHGQRARHVRALLDCLHTLMSAHVAMQPKAAMANFFNAGGISTLYRFTFEAQQVDYGCMDAIHACWLRVLQGSDSERRKRVRAGMEGMVVKFLLELPVPSDARAAATWRKELNHLKGKPAGPSQDAPKRAKVVP